MAIILRDLISLTNDVMGAYVAGAAQGTGGAGRAHGPARLRTPSCPATRPPVTRTRRLAAVLGLNLALIAALALTGLAARSLAVLAAAADDLADAAAIGVSLLAIALARRPPTPARPHGYPTATTVAALVNAGWLVAASLGVAVAAVQRLAAGAGPVDGTPVVLVSSVAAVVMLAGALILGGDADGDEDGGDGDDGADLNVRAVLLDTVADAAAAAGVAVTGAVILATGGWYWLDPAVALTIALIVGYHAARLARRCLAALRAVGPPA
jgi:cobalt-zinc-cadmium efflux system protein